MGNKLTPKVILEGTRLKFKTEIAFEPSWHIDPRIIYGGDDRPAGKP